MIGPLELVQNYEKAAKEFIAAGRFEQAAKELKKAILAIIDQQDNFDPDEFGSLVKTIQEIFNDLIKVEEFQQAYDSIILMNAFDANKKEVSEYFNTWLKKTPPQIINMLQPRILKFVEKNKLFKDVWASFSGMETQPQSNQVPVKVTAPPGEAKPIEQKPVEIKPPQQKPPEVKEEPKIEVKQTPQPQAIANPEPSGQNVTISPTQIENINKLKLALADTEISRGNFENARTLLSDILKTDPNNQQAKNLMAHVEEELKKIEQKKAIESLIKSAEPISSEEEEILRQFFSKNWKEANDAVTKAIARDRNNARLWAMKSIILKKIGDEKTSLNFESYSKRLDPNIQNTKLVKVMSSFN